MTYYFILRYVIFTVLMTYAAYVDLKSRLIPDYIWIIAIALNLPILAIDIWLSLPSLIHISIILILLPLIFLSLIMLIFWKLELIGEADIIFLAILAILFTFPTYDLPNIFSIPGFLIISIILISSLTAVIITILINIYRNIRLIRKNLLVFPENYNAIKKALLFIVATPVRVEEIDNLKYLPGVSFRLGGVTEHIKYKVNSNEFIWSTIGIPLITFFVIGLYAHIPFIVSFLT